MKSRDDDFTDYVSVRRKRLLRTAYLLCGDWGHAEDVLQLVLIKLYRVWPRVRMDKADAYVRRMIARTAVDEWRRPSRRATPVGDSLIDIAPPSTDGIPGAERSMLFASLQKLPPRQRQIVVLRHWWGCSIAEVAHDLGITQGAVKSQTARALERLKSCSSPTASAPTDSTP